MNKYLDEPNGKMKGGDAGIRLIEPIKNAKTTYFKANIQPIELMKGEFLIVPVYQIFGSDEMSSAASALSQRIPEPFVYLNPKDAEMLKLEADALVQLEIENTILTIKVRTEASINQGMAGLSVNLPGMPFVDFPGRGKFEKMKVEK
jgi:NADH-quinone oxidoreductase subunit G